jgi:hypothetical protein
MARDYTLRMRWTILLPRLRLNIGSEIRALSAHRAGPRRMEHFGIAFIHGRECTLCFVSKPHHNKVRIDTKCGNVAEQLGGCAHIYSIRYPQMYMSDTTASIAV